MDDRSIRMSHTLTFVSVCNSAWDLATV